MKNSVGKSTLALIAGFVVTFILSFGMDFILKTVGVLPQSDLNVSASLVLAVVAYRTLFNIAGSYVTARLAPRRPMKHVLILGIIGLIGSIIATVFTWNMNVGPHWYGELLAVLSVPSAWVGGKLYESRVRHNVATQSNI